MKHVLYKGWICVCGIYNATGNQPSLNKGPHRRKFMLQNVNSHLLTCVNSVARQYETCVNGRGVPLFWITPAGFWPSAHEAGVPRRAGANRVDAVVWCLKHDFVLLLCRTAMIACYFSLHQFWHLNIPNWKKMSFSWKNFLCNKVCIYSHPNICNDLISLNVLIGRSSKKLVCRVAMRKVAGTYFWH